MGRAYIYVDGENHFIRSVAALGKILGRPDGASLLPKCKLYLGLACTPPPPESERFGYNEDFKFFWDCELFVNGTVLGDGRLTVERAVYVTACVGDADRIHEARAYIRRQSFEPIVVEELKSQEVRRARLLDEHAVIEKPKGCDIALATRMVSDAAAGLFDGCALFTSDADFMPAIEAVRRLGKKVWVYGFEEFIGARSPFHYVPDRFVDLGNHWKHMEGNNRVKIRDIFGRHATLEK